MMTNPITFMKQALIIYPTESDTLSEEFNRLLLSHKRLVQMWLLSSSVVIFLTVLAWVLA